jgi:uncharacterized surface anchored protein
MRNHLRWLFMLVFGVALIGCQDDIDITNPVNTNTLNKLVDSTSVTTGSCQVGNRIWKDLDKDGIQDIGEKGFPGVTVCLYGSDGTWLYNCAVTNANGYYYFMNLQPGSYKLRIEFPDGWTLSPLNAGNDVVDSDFDINTDNIKPYSESFELIAGERDFSLDGGLYPTTELGEIGNKIWKDLNQNGIQEPYEEGFEGVTVCLYGEDGSWLYNCTQTDANGNYLLKDIQPGTYRVRMNIPAGWTLSPLNVGSNDAINSDFDISTDNTRPFSKTFKVIAGERNLLLDGGLYPTNSVLGKLGNVVWKDLDKDGIYDIGEPGIEGVKVQLYSGAVNPIKIKETTTNSSGKYLLADLPAGDYRIKFEVPKGYAFTKKNQGGDSVIDSDADTKTGLTKYITLSNGAIDLNWNAGLYQLRILQNELVAE